MEAHVWFVYELVVGSRMFGSIFKMYIAISLECASECVWAYSVCKYLLIVFVTIYGVICSSSVCQGDWLSTCRVTCMAESAVRICGYRCVCCCGGTCS